MTSTAGQFNFLEEYLLEVLRANKIILDDEQLTIYMPQLMAQLETRLGLKLLPELSSDQRAVLMTLMNDDSTTAAQYEQFWRNALPDFDLHAKAVLIAFSQRVHDILNPTAA